MCCDVLPLLQNPVFMQVNEYFTKKVKMPLAKGGIGYEVFNIITFDPLAPEG